MLTRVKQDGMKGKYVARLGSNLDAILTAQHEPSLTFFLWSICMYVSVAGAGCVTFAGKVRIRLTGVYQYVSSVHVLWT